MTMFLIEVRDTHNSTQASFLKEVFVNIENAKAKIEELRKNSNGDFTYTLSEVPVVDIEEEKNISKTRVINLYDCDTNFLVETNATEEEIENALAYKNDLLENDKPISSDFEAMQEYLMNKGYIFNEVGYVNEIESYEW